MVNEPTSGGPDASAAPTWATDRLDALIAGGSALPPVVETLRLGALDAWGPGWIRKSWHSSPELLNSDGSIFGGYLAALADQALAFAAMTVLPGDAIFRTVNLSLSFIRAGKAGSIAIEARVVARTRQLITTRAELRREDGELIAEASAQQIVQQIRSEPGS